MRWSFFYLNRFQWPRHSNLLPSLLFIKQYLSLNLMTHFSTWAPEIKSFARYKQLEGVIGCLIRAIWMIKPTSLSSTLAIGEIWPSYIRVTIKLLDQDTLILIVPCQILKKSKPCLEVTSSIISSKRPLGNLLLQRIYLFSKAYFTLILLWTLTRLNLISYLDVIELPTGYSPFYLLLLQLSTSLSLLFDTKRHSSSSLNKLNQCNCIALFIILRKMVGKIRFASSRCLLSSPWCNLPLFSFWTRLIV